MTLLHQAAQKAVEASLSAINEAAKVYASGYASPHHITFTVEGLRNLIAALQQQPEPVAPFWYAVVSDEAPIINKAIRRADVAEEYAQNCRENGYRRVQVVPLYTAPPALQHQEVPREPVGERISDERILRLWDTHVGDPSAKYPLSDFDKLEFARAVLRAAVLAPSATRQQEVGSEPQDCPVCKNGYLAIRTDIYKDRREFVYCDCCGCMADRRVWNRIAAAPSTPENAGGVPAPAPAGEIEALLRNFQSRLGESRSQCDEPGRVLWDRIERALGVPEGGKC